MAALEVDVKTIRGEVAKEHSDDKHGIFYFAVNLEVFVAGKDKADDKPCRNCNANGTVMREFDPH